MSSEENKEVAVEKASDATDAAPGKTEKTPKDTPTKENKSGHVKGTKRPADDSATESKKKKKEENGGGDDDNEEVNFDDILLEESIEECESEYGEEYDVSIPYEEEEDVDSEGEEEEDDDGEDDEGDDDGDEENQA